MRDYRNARWKNLQRAEELISEIEFPFMVHEKERTLEDQ
jgi:hypothetical protein